MSAPEGPKLGLSTALASADVGAGPIEEPVQLSLLTAEKAEQLGIVQPRGRGRPPGSLNRATEQWRDFLFANFTSPLIGMARVAAMPLDLLAAEVGCTRFEAAQLQAVARRDLAPYMHQKLPQAVELDARGVVGLVINLGGETADQAVSDASGVVLDAEVLNSTKSTT